MTERVKLSSYKKAPQTILRKGQWYRPDLNFITSGPHLPLPSFLFVYSINHSHLPSSNGCDCTKIHCYVYVYVYERYRESERPTIYERHKKKL